MNSRTVKVTLASVVLLGTVYGPATGTAKEGLPENQSVRYYVHEVPRDPNSEVVFAVQLNLTAVDSDGYWVGWEVTSVEFRQPGHLGELDTIWTRDLPEVETADGLWWVEHADPLAPTSSEFSMPPRLLGLARAENPQAGDLEYDVEGGEYVPPPEGEPYDDPVALTYSFTEGDDPAPTEEGEDEPVEVPDGYHDPD